MGVDYVKSIEVASSIRRSIQHDNLLRSLCAMHQHVLSLKRLHPMDDLQYLRARDRYVEMFDKVFYDKYSVECTKLRQYMCNDNSVYVYAIKEIVTTAFDKYRFTIRVSQDSTTGKICICISDLLTYAHLSNVNISTVYDIVNNGMCLTTIGFEQCVYIEDISSLVEALCL